MNPRHALSTGMAVPERATRVDVSQRPETGREEIARQLQQCPLFRGAGAAQLRGALSSAATRRVRKGGFYFRQGERAEEAYVLMRGRVKLVRTGPGARRGILRFVSPFDPFGYEDALGAAGRAASAEASEDAEALVWPVSTLFRIVTSHPVIADNCLRLMAERIRGTWGRLHGLLTDSLERRTVRALLVLSARLGRKVDGGPAIELRLARQDLAAYVGATPYAMSRVVSHWRRRGIVDGGRGWLVVWPRRLAALGRERGLPRRQR